MKIVLSILLTISIVGIASLGAFSVHTGMQDHDGSCAMALAQGVACPKQASPLDYASFHIGAFKSFSLATVGTLFALLVALAIALTVQSIRDPIASPKLAYAHTRYSEELWEYLSQREFVRWLALREHSPAPLLWATT